jgi:hypothetical protein
MDIMTVSFATRGRLDKTNSVRGTFCKKIMFDFWNSSIEMVEILGAKHKLSLSYGT